MSSTRSASTSSPDLDDWGAIRDQFDLSQGYIHLATSQFIASHPRVVREAIDEHRRALDANPIL